MGTAQNSGSCPFSDALAASITAALATALLRRYFSQTRIVAQSTEAMNIVLRLGKEVCEILDYTLRGNYKRAEIHQLGTCLPQFGPPITVIVVIVPKPLGEAEQVHYTLVVDGRRYWIQKVHPLDSDRPTVFRYECETILEVPSEKPPPTDQKSAS